MMGKYKFKIYDTNGNEVLCAVSPCCCALDCAVICLQDAEFPIVDSNGANIGVITKKIHNVLLTDLDKYRADFPATLPLEQKVLLVACSLLMNWKFFNSDRVGEH